MPFSRDQVSNNNVATSTGSGTNTATITFNPLPNANSFIVVCAWTTTGDIPTVSDGFNNYLRIVTANNNSIMCCHMFYTNYKLKLPGSPPLTITGTAPGTDTLFWGMQAASYTHSLPGTFLADTQAINTITGTASGFSYPSGSPQGSAELFVTAFGQNSSGPSEGVTVSQFSGVGSFVNDGVHYQVGGVADLIAVDSSFKSVFWDWTANDSVPFASVMVPFYLQSFPQPNATVMGQAVERAAYR